jgi:rod shape-determining protein MreC
VRARRYALLAAVIGLSLLLLTLQARGTAPGVVGDLVALLTTPVQVVLAKAHRGAVTVWETYQDWKALRAENAALRSENERLRVRSLRLEETNAENDRLRKLLGLRERLPMTTLLGIVIGREGSGWARALTVNRGRGDGIGQQTPAVVPEGLVGRVVRVRSGTAVIQLLNDPASTVGGVVLRTRTVGLLEGDAAGALRFKFMARDGSAIAPGDLIITSGAGTLFPKGLPVGRIVSIENRGSALFHFAHVAPLVDFERVEEVLLLTGQTPRDVAGAFAAGG